jgi:hypothetical protein
MSCTLLGTSSTGVPIPGSGVVPITFTAGASIAVAGSSAAYALAATAAASVITARCRMGAPGQ